MQFSSPKKWSDHVYDEILDILPSTVGDRETIASICSCSPYLAGILRAEPDWVLQAVQSKPASMISYALDDLKNDDKELPSQLRKAKKRIAFLVAYLDLAGQIDLAEVTTTLSEFADLAVSASLSFLLRSEFTAANSVVDNVPFGGMFALAMGKHGANELNYSSDIDLIMLFDDELLEADTNAASRKKFVRVTQRMVKLLSEKTADGYVFRTDLRLRPDPAMTPVCVSVSAAERYYESVGRS